MDKTEYTKPVVTDLGIAKDFVQMQQLSTNSDGLSNGMVIFTTSPF